MAPAPRLVQRSRPIRPRNGHPNQKSRLPIQQNHACRYVLAFRALDDESKCIQLFTRYETAHRRTYYKALDTLLKLRAELKPNPDPDPVQPPADAEQGPSKANPEPTENNVCETNPTSTERRANNERQTPPERQ